ncbi:MAG: PQQ-binding-like beta-propeller repeat protein [Prolixibacteraceae bacterium]
MAKSNKIDISQKSPLNGDLEGLRGRERSFLNIIVITAIFTVIVSILMLFNYLQLANHDPIESATISALSQRLADDPNNAELIEEIRAFDLMARKAYFTSQWQIKTGGWLLLLGTVILVVSLRYYFTLIAKIDEPDENISSQQTNSILSSKWLLATGATLILLAIISSFLSVDELKSYEVSTTIVDAGNDVIEVVDLTKQKESDNISTPKETENSVIEVLPNEELTASTSAAKEPATIAVEKTKIVTSNFPTLPDLQKQYNGFRGAFGQGISLAKSTPTSWDVSAGTNILWKVKVPVKGFSSPVIWNDKLFVTGANAQERWLYCYDKSTGKMLWQQQANNITGSPATPPKTSDDTGLAAPSVTTNGIQVVAIFGTGDIIAFDMNGQRIWAKNLGVPDNHYGHSSSLITWKEKVLIQYDTNKGSRLIALNIETGATVWETKRTSHISWASPILADVGGKIQVVTSAEPSVAGYDVESGKELWKVDCLMGEVGPSPAFGNGLVVATNEYATLAVIDPSKGSIVWENNEYLPEVASPVVADGLLIIATTYGVIACYDIHSGNKYWEAEYDEGFYSSPIVADGKIYSPDMKGIVHILKLDRELSKIADVAMGEAIMTTPSFSDGRMYIRGKENLYCVGK